MGGKGKRRQQAINQHGGSVGGGKKQKQSLKGKDDGDGGSSIVLSRSKKTSISLPIPGLMNLGNTCFFNSVMQNLAQTNYLRQKMREIVTSEKISVVLPPKESLPSLPLTVDSKAGKFAQDFHDFIEEMRTRPKQQPTLNPRPIFNHVCKNAPRFSSYQQQDSQELLRYLLDALRNEEVYRIKKAILEYYNVKGRTKGTTTPLTDNEKKAIKAYGLQALQHQTFVEDVFGGKIISRITCMECKTCCELEEGFLDLSLPVPSETVKSGFPSRSSAKNKKRAVRHSSEDAEGDDEGEGLHYGHQKVKNKDDPAKLSKHQLKQKRKEERKRSKGNKRLTLEQFHKEETINQIDSFKRNGSMDNSEISIESPSPSSSAMITRTVSMDTHDSCLADDEVTFLSTQQDSDSSSALCMNVGDINDMDTQQLTQNFTRSLSSSDEKTDEGQRDPPPSTPPAPPPDAEDSLNNKMQDLSLDGNNQNLSESLVAIYDTKDTNNQDTPLHSPLNKDSTPDNSQLTSINNNNDDGKGNNKPGEDWVPNFNTQSRSVPVINVKASLQNIGNDEVTETKNNQEEEKGAGEEPNREPSPTELSSAGENTKKKSPVKEVDRNSLEYCLEQFTSQELLTGNERFYCDSCSLQSSDQRITSRLKSSNTTSDSVQTTITSTQTSITTATAVGDGEYQGEGSTEDGYGKVEVEQLTTLVEREEVSSPERSVSSVSSSTSHKEYDEDTEMLESTKESDDNMDNVSHGSSSGGNDRIVLRDAIKQMLVTQPPAVLCLHLKRFIQQGRNFKNMRKNNCFISFPLILDIGPYCTGKCKTSTGTVSGQILYSLYGVVVHGGGMHGGHYSAFVRIRNELDIKDIIARPANTECVEPPTVTNLQTTNPPTVDINNNNTEVAMETDGATKMATTNEATTSTSASSDTRTVPETILGPSTEHDLSSTEGGSWYHISDSHVKKSTEAEVLRAEAYILFYERLPFTVKR